MAQSKKVSWGGDSNTGFGSILKSLQMPKEGENTEEAAPMINREKPDENHVDYSGIGGQSTTTELTYDLSTAPPTGAEDGKLPALTVTTGAGDNEDDDDDQKGDTSASSDFVADTPTSTFTDAPSESTLGRRLARKLSGMCLIGKCYDSSQSKHTILISGNEEEGKAPRRIDPPRLDRGWQFFEHFVLPRCYANRIPEEGGSKYDRARPGENREKTRLYPVWDTPTDDMADFGIGAGMYFKMVRFFAVVALLAAFMSTPSLIYYINSYSPDGRDGMANPLNVGTAICSSTSWQACPDCKTSDLDQWPTKVDDPKRIIKGLSPDGENDVVFIMKNECDINDTFSVTTLAVLLFFTVSMLFFIFSQRKVRSLLDEGEQTTSDYSIRIKNPPLNAKDPKEWKAFFEDNFDHVHVTVCTVALDNEDLIKKLVKRRKLLLKLQNKLPPHINFCSDDLERTVLQCPEPGFLKRFFCCSTGPKGLYDKVQALDKEIEMYADKNYRAASVYVTFEKEEMQRRVLKQMTYPKLCKKVVDSKYLFGGYLLDIDEPDEPSSIRWFDLNEKRRVRIIQRLCTTVITLALIFGGAFFIAKARESSPTYAALAIVLLNALTPQVVKFLTSFESHINETSFATSLYMKTTLFRWVNTAIVTAFITPFMYTAQDGDHLIESIRILFTAELIQRPILQLTDWQGNLKRHFLAPRAKDQRRMNLLFNSKEFHVGERYTDVTKILFLTCFYATIYPAAWYFAAATLFIYYWVDKFCVLRTWKQGPKISGKIAVYSVYYFLLCVATYAATTAYYISGFPFDNACATDETLPEYYEGTYSSEQSGINFTLSSGDKVYKYCDQNLFSKFPAAFPPFPSDQPAGVEWMSETQVKYLPMFAWTCFGIIITVASIFAIKLLVRFVVPLFFKTHKSQGKVMEDAFSEVEDIKAFIPCVDIKGFNYPHLMCDVSNVDHDLIGWDTDGARPYNLIFDLPQVLKRTGSPKTVGEDNSPFSRVMHWAPSSDGSESFDSSDLPSRNDSKLAGAFRFMFQ